MIARGVSIGAEFRNQVYPSCRGVLFPTRFGVEQAIAQLDALGFGEFVERLAERSYVVSPSTAPVLMHGGEFNGARLPRPETVVDPSRHVAGVINDAGPAFRGSSRPRPLRQVRERPVQSAVVGLRVSKRSPRPLVERADAGFGRYVRPGSKTEVAVLPGHVCLTPQSRHHRSPIVSRNTTSRSFSTDGRAHGFPLFSKGVRPWKTSKIR